MVHDQVRRGTSAAADVRSFQPFPTGPSSLEGLGGFNFCCVGNALGWKKLRGGGTSKLKEFLGMGWDEMGRVDLGGACMYVESWYFGSVYLRFKEEGISGLYFIFV